MAYSLPMNSLLTPTQEAAGPAPELPARTELLARTEPDVREPSGTGSEGINPLAAGMVAGGLLVVVVMTLVLKRTKVGSAR